MDISRKIYYYLKPFIPRRVQIILRRKLVLSKGPSCEGIWPIDESANSKPAGWSGWPDEKRFALVLTHDVESAKGQKRCYALSALEERLGFRSSFNFVAEEYHVLPEVRNYLSGRGFEVGIHGLRHDGKLYNSRKSFKEQAGHINRYLREWEAAGFRSPAMHHNLEWIHDLDIQYDASTFDTDPFEPQPVGIKTIFPFWVQRNEFQKGYVELPYTLPQDFTLFILMRERSLDIWKKKLDWIAEHGGMALLITHPDYINFDGKGQDIEEYPAEYYEEFLRYIKSKYEGQCWHVLPREMARFWKENYANTRR